MGRALPPRKGLRDGSAYLMVIKLASGISLLLVAADEGRKASDQYKDASAYIKAGDGYCVYNAFTLLYFGSFAWLLFRTLLDDSAFWQVGRSVGRSVGR
jgi:hypothetical protein